jgi:hypothetical protein
MTAASILFSIIASAFGLAYMTYGKRQSKIMPFLAGFGLCVYTYFVQGWIWLSVIGLALLALPFVVDL